MSRVLEVYLHERYAGQLIQTTTGQLTFTYDKTYVAEKQLALSLSIPLQVECFERDSVKGFFSGLLPDDLVRHRLARYLGVSEKNAFALLEAIGGECAGALSLYPKGVKPPKATKTDLELLDDQKLQDILNLLRRRPLLAGDDGLRLSLAGAQDKIAVGLYKDKIVLISGTTPTTHILKPMIVDLKDSVHNEWFCMRLASLVGIKVPFAQVRYSNKTPYFLVERYDRIRNKNGSVHRLHQEDFCQALGMMPDIRYEREGGPNLKNCQAILRQHSSKPAADQLSLLDRVIFNYLIGNADAHGKNFSLLYQGKRPELSPAYDLLSTAVYPNLATKMAMKIGGKYIAEEVFIRHWHRLVPDTSRAKANLEKQLLTLANNCSEKAYELKETSEKEGLYYPIFGEICSIIDKRAKRIQEQVS